MLLLRHRNFGGYNLDGMGDTENACRDVVRKPLRCEDNTGIDTMERRKEESGRVWLRTVLKICFFSYGTVNMQWICSKKLRHSPQNVLDFFRS
jgi:hypothetical protein